MSDLESLIDALARTAAAWRNPEYEPRARAVEATLEAPNTFTDEAIAFAVNQQMHELAPRRLRDWVAGRAAKGRLDVGVLNAGNVPMVELQDFLAVVLTGHAYVGSVSSKSPALLPAFVREVAARNGTLRFEFVEPEALFERARAVLATGSDETAAWVAARCDERGIPPARRLIRGHGFAAAVLDGDETEDDYEKLAEDVLLHEGLGCRNVAVVWAPEDLSPDGLLDGLARFRAVFPAHQDTPGRLVMQRAFLEAAGFPHAYGEGLEFLVSKGDPEPQTPGHLRWSPYVRLDDVDAWLRANERRLQLIVTRSGTAERLDTSVEVVAPGEAQRPPLAWRPDGYDTIAFLSALDEGVA